jgi:hypothetical protein
VTGASPPFPQVGVPCGSLSAGRPGVAIGVEVRPGRLSSGTISARSARTRVPSCNTIRRQPSASAGSTACTGAPERIKMSAGRDARGRTEDPTQFRCRSPSSPCLVLVAPGEPRSIAFSTSVRMHPARCDGPLRHHGHRAGAFCRKLPGIRSRASAIGRHTRRQDIRLVRQTPHARGKGRSLA